MSSLMNHSLYGNKSVWETLENDHKNNRLAHAYLFSGIKGLGKALTAKYFIKYLLKADEFLSKRIDEDNFFDLLYLNKKDKGEITIDQVRHAHDFFNQTAAEGRYKFVIIDAVDDLNLNAANALLKILEEPKANTYLFLISHNAFKNLATIRSRCRLIKFTPLSEDELCKIGNIEKYIELEDFIAGSPGILKICEDLDALNIYKNIIDLINNDDILQFNKFAEKSLKNSMLWELVQGLLIYLAIKIKNELAYEKMLILFSENEIYNLDKKLILLEAINLLKEKYSQ